MLADEPILDDYDTIAAVQRAHREACEESRRATSSLGLDDMVNGNRRGPLPLRWVYQHTLRELAQHCGHADILREQLINDASSSLTSSGPASARAVLTPVLQATH